MPVCKFSSFDREMRDYWGVSIPRPIRVGRLVAALGDLLYGSEEGASYLAALGRAAGFAGEKIRKVKYQLIQEGTYQWILQVRATTGPRRRTMCMVVAKDTRAFSKTAAREFELLGVLRNRNPEKVVKDLGSHSIPIEAGGKPGRLFVYWTGWLAGFMELGMDEKHRFALIGAEDVKMLTRKQGEAVRGELLEVLASLYEPDGRSALIDVQVNSGDFMLRLDSGRPQSMLIACRLLRSGLSPTGLLRGLLRDKGEIGDKPVLLQPSSPAETVKHLVNGLAIPLDGEESARRFVKKAIKTAIRTSEQAPAGPFEWEDLLKYV